MKYSKTKQRQSITFLLTLKKSKVYQEKITWQHQKESFQESNLRYVFRKCFEKYNGRHNDYDSTNLHMLDFINEITYILGFSSCLDVVKHNLRTHFW